MQRRLTRSSVAHRNPARLRDSAPPTLSSSRGRSSQLDTRLASFTGSIRPERRTTARRSSRLTRRQDPERTPVAETTSPRTLLVISATVTISRTSMTSGRVRTSTGRLLRPTSVHHTSPRFTRLPTPERHPRNCRAALGIARMPLDPPRPMARFTAAVTPSRAAAEILTLSCLALSASSLVQSESRSSHCHHQMLSEVLAPKGFRHCLYHLFYLITSIIMIF